METNAAEIYSRIKPVLIEHKYLLLYLIVGIWTFQMASHLPNPGLDPSWIVGINWAHVNDFQFGTDVVFTYGVLGFLGQPLILDYDLWKMGIIFSALVNFLLIFSSYLLLREFCARWYHYVFLIPILLVILPVTAPQWKMLISLSLFLYLILVQKSTPGTHLLYLSAIGFGLAVNSLIKFDMLWNSLYLILVFCGINYVTKHNIRQGATLLASFSVSFLAIWLTMQQHLENILPYLIGGLELTRGYSEAMAISGSLWQVVAGCISFLFIIMVGVYFFIQKRRELVVFFILTGFMLFSVFKSGFVRHDAHILTFLAVFALFLGFTLVLLTNKLKTSKLKRIVTFDIILCLAMIGSFMVSICIIVPWAPQINVISQAPSNELSLHIMSNETLFDNLVASQKEIIKNAYPLEAALIDRIDNQSVDIFPWDVALCWAYDLNWSPRPVFQSYTAYTPYLDTINSQHFVDDEESPKNILYFYSSIDGRYPLFEEPETFRTILNNYSYVDQSNGFIQLNRSSRPVGEAEDIGLKTVGMGEPIDIPDYNGEIFGYIDVRHTLWGTLMKTVYKPEPVYVQFRLKDGVVSQWYRFIPDNAVNGLFLSQYVGDADTLAWIFQGHLINDIHTITIRTDHPEYYEDTIQVRFVGLPIQSDQGDFMDPNSKSIRFYWLTPDMKSASGGGALEASYYRKHVNIRLGSESMPAIFEHPQGPTGTTIVYENIDIREGSRLEFSIGIDEGVWDKPESDGVTFEIHLHDPIANTTQEVFSYTLDPAHVTQDRVWHHFAIPLEGYPAGNVSVLFITRPNGNAAYDWAWWGDPKIVW